MKKLTSISALMVLILVSSCKKDLQQNSSNIIGDIPKTNYYDNQVYIAKTLAKAVNSEPILREKIKLEANKQFDRDYDVLFQAIKDDVLSDNESVFVKVQKFADDKEKFEKIINSMPLLTVLVPELPNFSSENWDAKNEIPLIAVKPLKRHSSVELYDATGAKFVLASNEVPGLPVLVIKDNERLIVANSTSESSISTNSTMDNNRSAKPYAIKSGFQYSFISSNFDNSQIKNSKNTNELVNQNNLNGIIDPISISAYKSGVEWQRDYIYYGLDPANGITSGSFRSNYYETITGFSFIHGYDYENLNVGDATNDPKPTKNDYGKGPEWTDGALEIRINVFMNQSTPLLVLFSVKPTDLFTIKYKQSGSGGRPPFPLVYDGLEPKSYNPNIRLIPFDLQKFGTTWKFAVSEYDPSEEITNTVTNTTTIATNFDFNATIFKIGVKFGASSTSTHTDTFIYKTTTGSDILGEGLLDFSAPVITQIINGPITAPGDSRPTRGTEGENYQTFDVTTGVVNLLVSPQKVF